MPTLWSKNLPEATYIRKHILTVIIGVIIGIVIFIILGIYIQSNKPDSHKNKATKSDVQAIASQSDTDWVNKASLEASQKITTVQPLLKNKKETAPTATTTSTTSNDQAAPQEALTKAMTAPISANQITGETNTVSSASTSSQPKSNISGLPQTQDDQNMQGEKEAFLKVNSQPNLDDYLSSSVQNPLSQYELQAGTIIPGILITGINSDLPGQITAQVRSNVYDSISGKYLLIPQGAKLTGLYDSQIAYGQQRVLIAWKRIIFPNGQSIDLQGMPGVDLSGYAGFNDKVDNHYFKIFGSVILISLLSAGAQLSQPQNQNVNPFAYNNPTVGQTLAQSLGTNLSNTGTMLTQKNINIQPTLVIRPGYEFNISVTKDMVFPGAYGG